MPNGGTFTPKGQLDVLVVYAGFTNDNNPSSPIYNNQFWPATSDFPTYSDDIFYPDERHFSLDSKDKSLSNFFYQMSRNSAKPLKIVGHKLPQRINVTATNEGNRKGWGHYFSAVYKEMQTLDGVDWKKYDQRTNEPNYKFDNSSSKPDGEIDFVIVVFRFDGTHLPFGTTTPFRNTYGLSTLFSKGMIKTENDEELKISTGFSISRGIDGVGGIRGFFLHENAHEMYDMPHVWGTNSAMGNKFNTTNGWGMMGINKVLNCANAWERWMMGWIELKHDFKAVPEENGTYELGDYLSTGEAIRIEIPHTNGQQHLWIENHQGKTVFDERDQWDGKIFPAKPRGLLMFVENISPSRNTVPKVFSYEQVNGLRTLSAAGNYDYTYSDTFRTHWQVGGNPVFDFSLQEENPIAGYSDVSEVRLDFKGSDLKNPKDKIAHPDNEITTRHSHGNELGCKKCKSEYVLNAKRDGKLTYNFLGEHIGFQVGDKIDLSSNPMLINTPNYVRKADSLSPFFLNNISIEIISKDQDGNLKLKILFDNNKIQQTTRYCGNIVLNKQNHTKPDLEIQAGKILRVDLSGTPNRAQSLTEGTQDFIEPSKLTLAKGSKTQIQAKGKISIHNRSVLILEDEAVIELFRKSRLRVDKSSSLIGSKNAKIIVHKGAKLKIKGVSNFKGTILKK